MCFRSSLIFILIICCFFKRNIAQWDENEAENVQPVIYGCDDKILSDLTSTLKKLDLVNDKIIFKLSTIEEKLKELEKLDQSEIIQNIENNLKETLTKSVKTEFNILGTDFLQSLTKTENNLKNDLRSLEKKFIQKSNELDKKLESTVKDIKETTQTINQKIKDSIEEKKNVEFQIQNVELIEDEKKPKTNLIKFEKLQSTPQISERLIDDGTHSSGRSSFDMSFLGKFSHDLPENCAEALNVDSEDGVFKLRVPGFGPFFTYCMHDPADKYGLSWTVIQRRRNGGESFYRNWHDYKNGFGDSQNDFWLGLEHIHAMTSRQNYELLIGLEDWEGQKRYAKYDRFVIGSESEKYPLKELGKFTGTAGDSLIKHKSLKFTTKDVDNDNRRAGNCAEIFKGAWWYDDCHESNLNGIYNSVENGKGVNWKTWHGYKYSLRYVQMAIRPRKL